MKKLLPIATVVLGGLFLFLDQILKYLTRHDFSGEATYRGVIGWKPFFNPGVAFSLPVPQIFILAFTFPVLVLLIFFFFRPRTNETSARPFYHLAISLVFFGALSNLIDRLLFQYTIDYVLVLTGVFNLADAMILFGFLLYLFSAARKKTSENL